MEVDEEAVIAAEVAKVWDAVDAYRLHMRQEAFHSMSPRWEDHNKVICQVITMEALPLGLRVDRQLEEPDEYKNQHSPTATKYSTTGTCVNPMALTSRTVTIQQHEDSRRWTTRRALHAKILRDTLTWDMLVAHGECIERFYPQTFDSEGQG